MTLTAPPHICGPLGASVHHRSTLLERREFVQQALAGGHDRRDIAAALGVSVETVHRDARHSSVDAVDHIGSCRFVVRARLSGAPPVQHVIRASDETAAVARVYAAHCGRVVRIVSCEAL